MNQCQNVVGQVEESDTENLPWSIAGDEEVVLHTVEERVVDVGLPRNAVLKMALSLLDDVDTSVVFRQRVMRTVPHFCAVYSRMPCNCFGRTTWGSHRVDKVRQDNGNSAVAQDGGGRLI